MKLKAQMRTGLGGNVVDDFFEAPEEMGLFTLSSIKGKEQLDDINNDEEPDIKIDSEEDNDEQEDSSSGSDPDELKRDYANEQYLDLLYEQYLIESSKYRHGISKRNQENKNKQKMEEIPEDLEDFSKYARQQDLSDEEIIIPEGSNPNDLLVSPIELKQTKVDRWFDTDFEDLGEDEDDVEEIKKIDQTIKRLQKKRKAEVDLGGHVEKKQRTFVGPEPRPKNWIEPSDEIDDNNSENDEEQSDEIDKYLDEEENDIQNGEVEEVPMEDIDSEEQAELLAMGELLLKPNGKQYLIDKSINKRSYDDNGLVVPRWFKEDEDKNNKPLIPVTKDMVMEYKRQLKSINSRSSKKVIEAKARKKKHLMDRLKKAREKAKSIATNSELGERDKIKQIQKLFKGNLTSKSKPNKVYVVSRNFTGNALPRGNLRIRLVDPRLKKDKRGKEASAKRQKKKKKRK